MRLQNIIIALAVAFAIVMCFADEAAASVGGPISAKQAAPTERARDIGRVERSLMSEKVSARLSMLGLDSKEALDAVSKMSDSELAGAAENLETIQTGGDMLFDLIILAALVVFIIWLLDYMRLHRYYN